MTMGLIGCRSCIEPSCSGCNLYELEKALIKGYFDAMKVEGGLHICGEVAEVVRCKDCKHRPYPAEPGKTYGLTIEAPDDRCPCYNEDDGWYSWVSDNEFFCAYGERKEDKL